jgi:hypothetical protein
MMDYPPEYDLLTEADVEGDRMCECGRSEKYKQGPYFDEAYAGESLEPEPW